MQKYRKQRPFIFFSRKFKTILLMLFDLIMGKITKIDKQDEFLELFSGFWEQTGGANVLFISQRQNLKLKISVIIISSEMLSNNKSLQFYLQYNQLEALVGSLIRSCVYLFQFLEKFWFKVSNDFFITANDAQSADIKRVNIFLYHFKQNFNPLLIEPLNCLLFLTDIIITQHQVVIKTMQNQNAFGFYYVPLVQNAFMQGGPIFFNPELYQEMLIQEQYRLLLEKNSLISTLSECNVEKERVEAQNSQLKELVSKSDTRIKRRYRKRRTWLQKKFRCNIKGCRGKYSSKIALNSHKRRKHPKKPKQ